VGIREYLWILKNYASTRMTDTRRIWDGDKTNIYLASRIEGSYYPYPTHPINIPNFGPLSLVSL